MKRPILPNEFKTESKPHANDPKKAPDAPESAPNDAQSALNLDPRPLAGEGAQGAGEGNAQSALNLDPLPGDAPVAAGFIPQIGTPTADPATAPSSPLSRSEGEGSRVREAPSPAPPVPPPASGEPALSELALEQSEGKGAGGGSVPAPDVVGAHRDAPKRKRGPKTPAGKARSSRNAVKHGIRSPHPFIIEGLESPEEWEELKLGIIESCQPANTQELELAINVAWDYWRQRRYRLHENAVLRKQVEETEEELQQEDAYEDGLPEGAPLPAIDPERLVHHQHLKVIPDAWSMDTMLRYEAQVRKALNQDMNMLEVLQARRNGERTPLARVQVDSGPTFTSTRRHNSASDIPAIKAASQLVRARVRLAEQELAERKRAARAETAARA